MQSANVRHRGCSGPLQRVVTDFGADQPFAGVMDKLVEHYGILLGESTIRAITQTHAKRICEQAERDLSAPAAGPARSRHGVLIVQMDGGMVPIVEPDATQSDQRKGKTLRWQEAKICLAHAQGSTTLSYEGTVQGDAACAGHKLLACAQRAGFGRSSQVHALGDGAPWIADQVEDQFGAQAHYLIDFYHVCEYLGAAAAAIVEDPAPRTLWLEEQKTRLKTRRCEELLQGLRPHLESPKVDEDNAPVRQCYRYLSHRREQLDHQRALERGLPIGSGEIESAHRYIVQQRLKRPGAWWREDNAEHMLALRLNRANRQWNNYWASNLKQAA